MRYSAKRGQEAKLSKAPIETAIPLLEPVRIYTALELAVMPLSKMNDAIAAQEKYYLIEHTTQMGGASHNSSPFNARWRTAHSGQREITYPVQDQKRIYPTTHYSTVRNAWIGEAVWGC